MVNSNTNLPNDPELSQPVKSLQAQLTRYELFLEIKQILQNIKASSTNPSDFTQNKSKDSFIRLFECINGLKSTKFEKIGISKTCNLISCITNNCRKTAENFFSVITQTLFDPNSKEYNDAGALVFSKLIKTDKNFSAEKLSESFKNSVNNQTKQIYNYCFK